MKPLLCPTWVPGGRKVKDQTFHFIYLGCKGDWPYLRKMMGLASGFRSLRLCHLCNEEVSQLYRPNNFHIFCGILYPTRPISFMLPKWINPRIGISLARKTLVFVVGTLRTPLNHGSHKGQSFSAFQVQRAHQGYALIWPIHGLLVLGKISVLARLLCCAGLVFLAMVPYPRDLKRLTTTFGNGATLQKNMCNWKTSHSIH